MKSKKIYQELAKIRKELQAIRISLEPKRIQEESMDEIAKGIGEKLKKVIQDFRY